MESTPGTRLATLLDQAFHNMVNAVVDELDRRGHPGVTATLEFALVAIRAGAGDASALGRALGVSKQAAAKTIATLETLGYVRREPDPVDARRKLLTISERGEEMTVLGAAAFDRLRLRWAESVGIADVERAERALAVLLDLDGISPVRPL
ncbi:MarR family winged helix-turn-helix transcriptional regulator [Microbacterium enclense]|nr:MarR family transcriptional regulator [Microbacterium enclense]